VNVSLRLHPPRGLRSWSGLACLLLAAATVSAVLAVVVSSRGSAGRDALTQQLAPLRTEARTIESSLAAMDNAVRAYAAGGPESAITPYAEASQQLGAAEAEAQAPARALGGNLTGSLAQVADAAAAWQRAAGPLIEARRAGQTQDSALGDRANAQFDAYRAAMAAFAGSLDARDASLRSAVDQAETVGGGATWTAGAAVALAALLLAGTAARAVWHRWRGHSAAPGSGLAARPLLDGLRDAVFVIDPKTMRLRDANQAAERLSGRDKRTLIALPAIELSAAVADQGLDGAVGAVIAAGLSDRSYRFTWVQPSGARVPLEGLNGVAHADGAPLLVAVLRDLRGRLEDARELGDSRDQLEAIIQGVADGIVVQDPAGTVTYANETAARILGYGSAAELFGKTTAGPTSRFELLDERGQPFPPEQLPMRRVLDGELEVEAVVCCRARGGTPASASERWVVFRSSAVLGEDGRARFVLSVLHDLTALMRAQEELRRSRDQLNAILQGVADGITVLDPSGRSIYANDAAAQLFGLSAADELLGRRNDPWRDFELTDEDGLPVLRESLPDRRAAQGKEALETLVCARPRDGGEERWLMLKSAAIRDEQDRVQFAVNVLTDITERRRAGQLERQSLTDSLTGLPNRRLVDDRLQQALFVARRNRGSLALLFIDLNRFKAVNDTLGHQAGDQLLQEVGVRLQESLRQSDTVARLGGDEFTVILPGARPPGAAAAAEKILKSLEQPFSINRQPVTVGASIGIAFYPDDAHDAATLTHHADLAMYVAKRSASGHAIYSSEMDDAPEALAAPRISA